MHLLCTNVVQYVQKILKNYQDVHPDILWSHTQSFPGISFNGLCKKDNFAAQK
jgi:hypothetical protein